MAVLDTIEWAVSTDAETLASDAGEKANGWIASQTAASRTINWMWREQAKHLIFSEHHAALFDSVIIDP